jgi:hypothetical protein
MFRRDGGQTAMSLPCPRRDSVSTFRDDEVRGQTRALGGEHGRRLRATMAAEIHTSFIARHTSWLVRAYLTRGVRFIKTFGMGLQSSTTPPDEQVV